MILDFVYYLEANPYEGNQEQCGTGKDYWNADMWTLEVARCLLHGDDYVLPMKYKHNKFADPNRIKHDANVKRKLKNLLQEIKDSADVLLIGEVGRGLDILVANTVKKWKTIICYDQVNYQEYLRIFDNVHFIQGTTATFEPAWIAENHIFIINHSIYKKFDRFKAVSEHGIIDGEMVW